MAPTGAWSMKPTTPRQCPRMGLSNRLKSAGQSATEIPPPVLPKRTHQRRSLGRKLRPTTKNRSPSAAVTRAHQSLKLQSNPLERQGRRMNPQLMGTVRLRRSLGNTRQSQRRSQSTQLFTIAQREKKYAPQHRPHSRFDLPIGTRRNSLISCAKKEGRSHRYLGICAV